LSRATSRDTDLSRLSGPRCLCCQATPSQCVVSRYTMLSLVYKQNTSLMAFYCHIAIVA